MRERDEEIKRRRRKREIMKREGEKETLKERERVRKGKIMKR